MSEKSKPLRVYLGDKNLVFLEYNGSRLRGGLYIRDRESLDVNKTDKGVWIDISIPSEQIVKLAMFTSAVLYKVLKGTRRRAKEKRKKVVDIDEILSVKVESGEKGESEDFISLME